MEWVKKVFGHFLAIFCQNGPTFPILGPFFNLQCASPGGYANFNLRVYLILLFRHVSRFTPPRLFRCGGSKFFPGGGVFKA